MGYSPWGPNELDTTEYTHTTSISSPLPFLHWNLYLLEGFLGTIVFSACEIGKLRNIYVSSIPDTEVLKLL